MMQQQPGRPINLTTERFLVRSLTPDDASETWCDWFRDRDIMSPLNLQTRDWTLDRLAEYCAGFNNETRRLIGVFTKAEYLHIGQFLLEADEVHATATFNVMIGDKHFWGRGIVNEARAALLDEIFERNDVEKACGRPFARNFPAVFNYKAQGWHLEGILRGHAKSVVDGSRLDQCIFGMLRHEWRARRKQST
jgi:RimJ/RimL family protein N-acetyltransferase